MAVCEGARQPRCDLGAEDRGRRDLKILFDRGEIETGEMEKLQPGGIAKYLAQIGCGVVAARRKAHQMFIAAAIGYLQQAKPVAQRIEAHGFGVDRQSAAALQHAIRQVFFVEENAHPRSNFLYRDIDAPLCPSNGAKASFTTFTPI